MEQSKTVLFEKYTIGKLLGTGNFAKVYHGTEISTGDEVAIKVIKKDLVLKRRGMTEQIEREIAVMRLLRHPNVVELREMMATKTKIFFVMEYVDGGELFERLDRDGKLPENLARKYFQQLISAVDFCHSRGVYHRDIKPENLLLDGHGDLKVTDFGLSALMMPEGLGGRRGSSDDLLHTRCGTPAYVAPEVLRNKGYDGAMADIWSCGIVLYALLAGFLPFIDENVMTLYTKIFKAEIDFPPWFSSESQELISKLLLSDPEQRITMSEIKQFPWFRKNFTPPEAFSIDETLPSPPPDPPSKKKKKHLNLDEEDGGSSPRSFNAFQLISSMSSGFDLSSLFEIKRKPKRMFTSKLPAITVKERLEEAAPEMNMRVKHVKDCKMKLQSRTEGRKGRLSVTAEVFEVAPEVSVVEFCKTSGDTLEYQLFCEDDVRPALKDIVWSWQGDDDDDDHVDTHDNDNIMS